MTNTVFKDRRNISPEEGRVRNTEHGLTLIDILRENGQSLAANDLLNLQIHSTNEPSLKIGLQHIKIGYLLSDGKKREALSLMNEIIENLGDNLNALHVEFALEFACVCMEMHEYSSAENFLTKLVEKFKEDNILITPAELVLIRLSLATVKLKQGKVEDGANQYYLAVNYLEKINQANTITVAIELSKVANLFFHFGRNQEAINILGRARDVLGTESPNLFMSLIKSQAQIYLKTGDSKSYMELSELLISFMNELSNQKIDLSLEILNEEFNLTYQRALLGEYQELVKMQAVYGLIAAHEQTTPDIDIKCLLDYSHALLQHGDLRQAKSRLQSIEYKVFSTDFLNPKNSQKEDKLLTAIKHLDLCGSKYFLNLFATHDGATSELLSTSIQKTPRPEDLIVQKNPEPDREVKKNVKFMLETLTRVYSLKLDIAESTGDTIEKQKLSRFIKPLQEIINPKVSA